MSGVSGVNSDRNYDSIINSAGKDKTENVYGDAIFADSTKDSLSVNDFFNLMITQLTNQDFMKPVDDTQYLAQLAQFSTMQQMTELAQYSKTNYATSLIGKEVTVATNDTESEESFITGMVDRVSVKNEKYYVQVNGKDYSLSQINSFGIVSDGTVENPDTSVDKDDSVDNSGNVDGSSGSTENNTDSSDENGEKEVQFWL